MSKTLSFRIHRHGRSSEESITVDNTVIAGWTGRDPQALEKHIRELEEKGIARPRSTPIFYRVAAARLSTDSEIEVSGGDSTGEVEFVLVQHKQTLFVGVGSDHTDRRVEAYSVTVSKQMCEKPIASELWAWEEVEDHWESLELKSWINDGEPYQGGLVTEMRLPADLIGRYTGDRSLADGTVMFCGTLAAMGGIRPAKRFTFELYDPVLLRSLKHSYSIRELGLAE
jgi:hypothetical protein